VALSGVAAGEESTHRMQEKLEPNRERHRTVQKSAPLFARQIGNGLKVKPLPAMS
jgi:hypothetical protein